MMRHSEVQTQKKVIDNVAKSFCSCLFFINTRQTNQPRFAFYLVLLVDAHNSKQLFSDKKIIVRAFAENKIKEGAGMSRSIETRQTDKKTVSNRACSLS